METTSVRSLLGTTLRFFFPNVCMVCGKVLSSGHNCSTKTKDLQICNSCLSKLPVRRSSERWFPCLSDPYEGDPVPDLFAWALFHYEMPVTSILKDLKFRSRRFGGELISELMGMEFPKDLPVKWDAVVPVPLSEKRMETRGFNQAEVLAEGLCRHLDIPLCNNVIQRTRHTHQQSRFTEPAERQENVKGAFAVDPEWDITGWNILLVDDILTTGSTLHEAARILKESGAAEILCVVSATHRT